MSEFKQRVEKLVEAIPRGRVISYGDIAAFCGRPRAARQVGQLAHYGTPNLPWHRVVKKDGGLAGGYPGGMRTHQVALEAEDIEVIDFIIKDMEQVRWHP